MLYTVRVIAGGVLIGVEIFERLAFSRFVFVALSLMKRYTELTVRLDTGCPIRRIATIPRTSVLAALSTAMAANAVISSATVVARRGAG